LWRKEHPFMSNVSVTNESTSPDEADVPLAPQGWQHTLILPAPSRIRVEQSVHAARDWLLGRQAPSGAWCEQLEGDTTLESYWILLDAFLCRGLADTVNALACSIRERALPAGGWPQYPGGPAELSVSCLSYFALKVAGDRADEPHMARARAVIA